jgi:hypothetical protein
MRLVPNQDWEQITELFTQTLYKYSCWGNCKVRPHHGGQGYVTLLTVLDTKQQIWYYTETFGVPAIPVRSGGSIPIVALLKKN